VPLVLRHRVLRIDVPSKSTAPSERKGDVTTNEPSAITPVTVQSPLSVKTEQTDDPSLVPFPYKPDQFESWSDYVAAGPTNYALHCNDNDDDDDEGDIDCGLTLDAVKALIENVYREK
jgi:hypothetical protein